MTRLLGAQTYSRSVQTCVVPCRSCGVRSLQPTDTSTKKQKVNLKWQLKSPTAICSRKLCVRKATQSGVLLTRRTWTERACVGSVVGWQCLLGRLRVGLLTRLV